MSQTEATERPDSADINRVMELLPHRYPMLMIDRIKEMKGRRSASDATDDSLHCPDG